MHILYKFQFERTLWTENQIHTNLYKFAACLEFAFAIYRFFHIRKPSAFFPSILHCSCNIDQANAPSLSNRKMPEKILFTRRMFLNYQMGRNICSTSVASIMHMDCSIIQNDSTEWLNVKKKTGAFVELVLIHNLMGHTHYARQLTSILSREKKMHGKRGKYLLHSHCRWHDFQIFSSAREFIFLARCFHFTYLLGHFQ